jgi:ABC-type branched-subunit amino acid transport system substrate-binding protein
MKSLTGGGAVRACVAGLTSALAAIAAAALARTAEPIKIGFGMALTGGSANGKSALLAMKIWEEDINAAGGLLGRPVRLVYYDDQSNPATVPALFTARAQSPKPKTIAIAIADADAEFAHNAADGARLNAKAADSMTERIRPRQSIARRSYTPFKRPIPTFST